MRFVVAVLSLGLVAGPARAADSLWVLLESYRIAEPLCREEIGAALKGLSVADLGEATTIIRDRELAVIAKVKTAGNSEAARIALDDYRENITRQIGEGIAAKGCAAVIKQLGLDMPKPVTKAQITELARSVSIGSTERTDTIPVADRVGTMAAYPLQKILTLILTKDTGCDARSLKVTVLNEVAETAANAPPFVGTPKAYEERWQMQCAGEPRDFRVSFRQDARKWRSYKTETKRASPAADNASAAAPLRPPIEK